MLKHGMCVRPLALGVSVTGSTDFGAELRRRRQAAGVSLNQLAALVHYSKSHLSKVESGRQQPRPEFARVCDAALNAGGALVAVATDTARGGRAERHNRDFGPPSGI